MWFSYPRDENWVAVPIHKVKEIQQQNKDGVIPADLGEVVQAETAPAKALDYENVVGQDSLTRLDERRNNNNNKNKSKNKNRNSRNPNQNPQQVNQPGTANVVQNNRPPRPEGERPQGNRQAGPRPEGNRPQQANRPVDGNKPQGEGAEGNKPQGNNPSRRHKHRRPNQNNQNRPGGDKPGPAAE